MRGYNPSPPIPPPLAACVTQVCLCARVHFLLCAAECHPCVGRFADHHHMHREVLLQQGRYKLVESVCDGVFPQLGRVNTLLLLSGLRMPSCWGSCLQQVQCTVGWGCSSWSNFPHHLPPAAGGIEMALTKPGQAAGFPSLNHTNSSTSASISQQTIGYLFLVGNTACMVRWEGQVGTWSDGRGTWGRGQMGGAHGDVVRWEGHMGT